jgi:hypothetical protein
VKKYSPANMRALQSKISTAQTRLMNAISKWGDVETAAKAYMALLAEYRASLFSGVVTLGLPQTGRPRGQARSPNRPDRKDAPEIAGARRARTVRGALACLPTRRHGH